MKGLRFLVGLAPALLIATALLMTTAALAEPAATTIPGDAFAKQATLKAPDAPGVQRQALDWLARQGAEKSALTKAQDLWKEQAASRGILETLVNTLALGDARIAELADLCSQGRGPLTLPNTDWLGEQEPLARDNLRLYYGRWLTRVRRYDEALLQLEGLDPQAVVDPASVLFHQAVANHRLLKTKPGLAVIERLLDDVSDCPMRYRSLASLMQADLEQFKIDSLDHASRLMDDAGRRLDLGRTGSRVRKVEDDVVAILNKLIEEEEKRQAS